LNHSISNKLINKKIDFNTLGLAIIIIVLIIGFSLATPYFLTVNNVITIMFSVSVIGIAAVAQTMLVISGGIDLSQESVIAATGITIAIVDQAGMTLGVSLITGIFVGIITGLINGLLVTKARINPLITTLGMMGIVKGYSALLSNDEVIPIQNDSLKFLARGFKVSDDVNLPLFIIILIALFLIFQYLLSNTIFGRRIYAIGGSPQAALCSGINVDVVRIIIYIISGTLAAFSGIVYTSITGMGYAYATDGYIINILASVFLGGTLLGGGRGKIHGTFLGILIIGIINNGLTNLGVTAHLKEVVIGIILIITLTLSQLKEKRE